MSVDSNAVARVLGITTTYKPPSRAGATVLPQRLLVIAPGATRQAIDTAKFTPTRQTDVIARAGAGSLAHLVARELWPSQGQGIGGIPVDFCLLEDDGDGVAATAKITPSGTQSVTAAYRVVIAGLRSERFVIPAGASITTICRRVYEAIVATLELPVDAAYDYGTVTAAHSTIVGASNGTVTALSVTANRMPKPGAWELRCVTAVTNGGVWRLTDPDGIVIETALTQTVGSGVATVFADKGGLTFTVTDGTTDFGVGDIFTITVPAEAVDLTFSCAGEVGNDCTIGIEGEDLGVTFALVNFAGGAVNPEVDAALAQIGSVWNTLVLNALNIEDTDVLDAIRTVGEARWDTLIHKPFVAFTGNVASNENDATAISSARRTDRINGQLVAPGSPNLPCMVAAAQIVRIARVADDNPPVGYGAEEVTSITPGADSVQWDAEARERMVQAGSSTVEVVDGVVQISDVVTFYRPQGDPLPAYRQVVAIVKLQQIIFNLALIFGAKEWAAAPLIPDDQVTINPKARKPLAARTAIRSMVDALALDAIIANPTAVKKTVFADIGNPDSIVCGLDATLSGNTNVKDVRLNFTFNLGASAAA